MEDCTVVGHRDAKRPDICRVTSLGRIACEVVVDCARQWAREVGRMAGVNVPLVSVQHQHLITDAIPGITGDLPTLAIRPATYYKKMSAAW